jgi:signal transduction histidine kinase
MVKNRFRHLQQPEENKIREHLDLIEAELVHSDEVIDGLLRMSDGKKINIISFDLIALVNEVAEYCRLNESVSFATDFAESPFLLLADPALFRQVFINLLTNAEQAMPKGGTITVKGFSSLEGETVITVSDTGCGIDETDIKKVFDTLHTTKVGGVGLGLSLCRDILQRHDGTILLENVTDIGAKVVITLPNKST